MRTSEDQDHGQRVVIVGAGLAGVQTAVALREAGWTGPVTLLGAEPHPPYDRPPLSKAVLLGTAEGAAFDIDLAALGVRTRLGTHVIGVRPDRRELLTATGPVGYDQLVIATGAEPIALPGTEEVAGVHLLRTLDDARRLRPVLTERRDLVIVGAGWIGAEVATAARAAGCAVTVVEAADRPLAGALPAEVTAPMADWYAAHGVTLRTGARVAEIDDAGVLLADGTLLPAGAVLVGIGARPATGWLAGSGIELAADGSVAADARLRASVPGVHAVGDCASFPSGRFGTRLLVHHWDNALQGPRTVAADLVAGAAAAGAPTGGGSAGGDSPVYDPVPYFWSEQFGRFVQYAGHHGGADALVRRGDPADAAWSVCWLRAGALVAVLTVGRPRDLAQGRRLIERGSQVDPALVADPAVPLKSAAR